MFDEPRAGPQHAARVRSVQISPAERAAGVIVRAAKIMLTAEAMKHTAKLRPRLTPAERVEHAEWASAQDAGAHYWRTMARYAALACDEGYVRRAYEDRAGGNATHEQHVVLMTRRQDLGDHHD
jgi:hypothetical protein